MPDKPATSAIPHVGRQKRAWFTGLAVVACVVNFFLLIAEEDLESWETLTSHGYVSADAIWNGAIWSLWTSVFVHLAFWHVACNVYQLWVLGSRMERKIGTSRYIVFFASAAFISSAVQLALTDDTGIGASGVVYAFFGFMWPLRHRIPEFKAAISSKVAQLFVVWLFGCVLVTYLKIWEVGNGAHISGMLFGGATAAYFVIKDRPRLMLAGLSVLVLLAVVPLLWCPWSVTWLSNKAYHAQVRHDYHSAIDFYSQIISIDSQDAWAYYNRSGAHAALGNSREAQSDLKAALEIDPTIAED